MGVQAAAAIARHAALGGVADESVADQRSRGIGQDSAAAAALRRVALKQVVSQGQSRHPGVHPAAGPGSVVLNRAISKRGDAVVIQAQPSTVGHSRIGGDGGEIQREVRIVGVQPPAHTGMVLKHCIISRIDSAVVCRQAAAVTAGCVTEDGVVAQRGVALFENQPTAVAGPGVIVLDEIVVQRSVGIVDADPAAAIGHVAVNVTAANGDARLGDVHPTADTLPFAPGRVAAGDVQGLNDDIDARAIDVDAAPRAGCVDDGGVNVRIPDGGVGGTVSAAQGDLFIHVGHLPLTIALVRPGAQPGDVNRVARIGRRIDRSLDVGVFGRIAVDPGVAIVHEDVQEHLADGVIPPGRDGVAHLEGQWAELRGRHLGAEENRDPRARRDGVQ